MDCSTLGFPVLHHLLEFVQTHVPWVSETIQPSHPLSSPYPPAFNLSQNWGLFQWIALHIRWPNTGASASASVLPMNIQCWFPLGLLDLLAVQGPLNSLLQHHSSKASILQHSAFFMDQHTHLHLTIGKTSCLSLIRILVCDDIEATQIT